LSRVSRSNPSLDFVIVFVVTAALIWPLFKLKYLDRWGSIESTFISDARFLNEHWPHPRWQPLWYCGTRFDYIYPPALRYGTAAITKFYPKVVPARAYHLYTAFFYCIGIAGVYLFVRVASGSRGAGYLAAVAAALLSPSFLFIPLLRHDASGAFLVPLRLGVLVRYGEGPHMTSFALLPVALASAWRGIRNDRPAMLAVSAFLCAWVALHNFYGATALAIFFPILVWSLWITSDGWRTWMRAAVIVALAYGLTAFWLTPSYFRITMHNLQYVSQAGNAWSRWIAAAIVIAYCIMSWKLGRARPQRAYSLFVCGCAVLFLWIVLGHVYLNVRILGEPHRLTPELDLILILVAVEFLRRLWLHFAPLTPRILISTVVLLCFYPSHRYLQHAWHLYPRDTNYQQRIEYRLTDWIAKNMPDSRNVTTGSVRFWYDAWHDLAELGGGSDQGVLNPAVVLAQYETPFGRDPEPAVQWMLCVGADAVLVHDKNSQEHYHDFADPNKFSRALPVIYDDRAGNVIYRVPRRFPGIARVVDSRRIPYLKPVKWAEDLESLRAYADVLEKGPDSPATVRWEGTDVIHIRAQLKSGESILLLETYDPNWHAWSGGRELPIHKDVMNFMWIETPPGAQEIRLSFETPLENRIGQIVTALSIAVFLCLIGIGYRRARPAERALD
jgi:hypothetical protein